MATKRKKPTKYTLACEGVVVDAKGVPVVEKTATEIMAEIERERLDPMYQLSMLPQLPFHDFQAADNRRRERDRSEAIETAGLAEIARRQAGDAYEASKQGAVPELAEQRQARRFQDCIEAGLTMPKDDYGPMPRGIGAMAKKEGISRQSYTEDLKKHINRQ